MLITAWTTYILFHLFSNSTNTLLTSQYFDDQSPESLSTLVSDTFILILTNKNSSITAKEQEASIINLFSVLCTDVKAGGPVHDTLNYYLILQYII